MAQNDTGTRTGAVAALAATVMALTLLMATPAARACAPQCAEPHVVLEADATVPANAPGVLWLGGSADEAELVRTEDKTVVAVTVADANGTPRIDSATPWAEGETYSVRWEPDEGVCGSTTDVAFSIGPAAPLPETLGTLSIDEPYADELALPDGSSQCSSPYEVARADATLALDGLVEPWWDSMSVELRVDDEPWAYSSPLNDRYIPGRVRPVLQGEPLVAYCGTTKSSERRAPKEGELRALAQGTHEVQFVGTLPDGTEVRSNAVTVTLECPAPAGCAVAARSSGPDLVWPLALLLLATSTYRRVHSGGRSRAM